MIPKISFINKFIVHFATLIKRLILAFLRGYQLTLSPDHGWGRVLFPRAGCRYYPSCSEYARQSITHHSLSRGIQQTLLRLARCHPWSQGGFDPVEPHTIGQVKSSKALPLPWLKRMYLFISTVTGGVFTISRRRIT